MLAGIVALLLAGSAWVIGQQLESSPTSRHASKPSPSAAGLTQFRDPAGTFQVSYPSSWQRLQSTDPQDVLLASGPGGASLLVAKTPVNAAVSTANLSAAKRLTDRVVSRGKQVIMLRRPQLVTLAGLPGYLYLYTFVDPSTGGRGAHAHYFLFRGTTMITLVFQALPSNNFVPLASLFDRVAGTLRVLRS